MNKLDSKKKIWGLGLVAIIIVGIIIIATKGFNLDLRYKESQRIQLDLEKNFEVSDIKKILDEIKPNEEILIQKVEVFEDSVSITAKEITEADKASIINKVNEKYGTELNNESIEVETVPNTQLSDIVIPYVVPFITTTIIILIYMCIKYRYLGLEKVFIKSIIIILTSQFSFISVIAITRIPVSKIVIILDVVLYLITFIVTMCKFEKEKAKFEDSEK